MKIALQDRAIDFAQIGRGGFVFHADNDAIWMEEISDGGTFAKKFGIRSHAKIGFAAAAVGCERSLQFESGARGYGALFDHQLGGARLLGDLPRDLIDRGKVSLAAFFGRRAHANKNGITRADRFACIRRYRKCAQPCARTSVSPPDGAHK